MLQKKKNRSSIPRATRKPKSKRLPIKASSIVAANWDKHLTLSQNYHRLGLASKLNTRGGGIELNATVAKDSTVEQRSKQDPLAVAAPRPASTPGLKTVKVARDEEGKILRVIHTEKAANPLNDPLDVMDDGNDDEDTLERLHQAKIDGVHDTAVVQELEAAALAELLKVEQKKKPRRQSRREREWIEHLVAKHGENVMSMTKDRKLNPNQQTEADIRRRLERWRKSRS